MSKVHHHTQQRQVVGEIVQSTTTHPSVQEIYEEARTRLPHISLGTVYRILHSFKEEGLVQQMTDARNVSRFDGRTDRHPHLVCLACNRMIDLDLTFTFRSLVPDPAPEGFQVVDYRLEFYGYCRDCCETY